MTCTFGLMLAVTLGCPNYGVPGLLGTNPGAAGAFSVVPMRPTAPVAVP